MLKKRCYEFPSYHLIPSHWALVDQIVPETNLFDRWWLVPVLILMRKKYCWMTTNKFKQLVSFHLVVQISPHDSAATDARKSRRGRGHTLIHRPQQCAHLQVGQGTVARTRPTSSRLLESEQLHAVRSSSQLTEGKRASAADTSAGAVGWKRIGYNQYQWYRISVCSFCWFIVPESTVRWCVVREKHCWMTADSVE
jgi:hypothetical protein